MGRTPNDDRSDSMNPNNDAYWDSLDNHANQLNPNHDEYQGEEVDDDEDQVPDYLMKFMHTRYGTRSKGLQSDQLKATSRLWVGL